MFCAAVAASYRVWSFLFWNVAMQVPCSVSKTVQKVSSLAALATALPTSRTIYERKYPALAASLCVCVWFTFFTFLLNDISFFSLRQNSYLLYIFVIKILESYFFSAFSFHFFPFLQSLFSLLRISFIFSFLLLFLLSFYISMICRLRLCCCGYFSLFLYSHFRSYIIHTAIPHYWYDSYFWFSA